MTISLHSIRRVTRPPLRLKSKDSSQPRTWGRRQHAAWDRFTQLGAVATLEALENSGVKITPENGERMSVMVSSGIGGIITLSEQTEVLLSRGPSRISPFLVPMMLPDMAAGQISMLLGAKGPNFIAVSACSSGADAIGQAFETIRRGDVDVIFAGGCRSGDMSDWRGGIQRVSGAFQAKRRPAKGLASVRRRTVTDSFSERALP